ncbi:phage portal protein family protein [Phenylobacterium sp.]|uniref:phage portal protein family protein n=1 Tax=Phenylobacterium sp. TaxID=1871053 RepID=UPI003BEF4A08
MPSKKILSEEVARPGLTGVRQAWSTETAVRGLTPDRLAAIMRQADQGDMDAFLTLAEEMEERDPHYGSVLQTRKLAVVGLERQLVWAPGKEKDPLAEEIHEACGQLVADDCLDELLLHLLDAIAKGYAAPEIIWDTSGNQWSPERYEWRDPRWFRFDRETGRELRLKEMGEIDGVPLPPYKFAVHLAGRKSGLAARAGLARLVAFSFVCKLYGLKDWMAYAEIFGIPMRLGKYDAAAQPEDIEVLKRAVFNLGADAAAVIPAAMTIEFPTAGGAAAEALFENLVKFLDAQVSKAVLGQTMTTDDGASRAQAQVHDGVRTDLVKADATAIGATVTRDVLTPFVRFNWGPQAPVPRLTLVVEEPEDMDALGQALERLVPLGLKVAQTEVRKKLKLSEPDAGADLLTPPTSAPAAPPPPGAAPVPADPNPGPGDVARARGQLRAALARSFGLGDRHPAADRALDELQSIELDGWSQTFGPEAAAVIQVVKAGGSFDEILVGLTRLAADLSAPAAARSLVRAMFEAAAIAVDQVRPEA